MHRSLVSSVVMVSLVALACGASDEANDAPSGGPNPNDPGGATPGGGSSTSPGGPGSNDGPPKVVCPADANAWNVPKPAAAAAPFVFQVVGDVHAHASDARAQVNIGKAMADLAAMGPTRQLLVVNGDLTEHGTASEYGDLANATNGKVPAQTMWLIGNHDYHGGDSSAVERQRYLGFTKSPNVYFDRNVGGYTFIALGGENGEGDPGKLAWTAVLSDAQLAWLDQKLTSVAHGDKPVFVFLHQGPWDSTNQVRLNQVLGAHPNVVFFWSHYHRDLHAPKAPQAFQDADNYWKVHTGAVQYNWDSGDAMHYDWAQGLQVEVSAGQVLVRGRDFTAKQWIATFQHPIVREDNPESNGATMDFDGDGLSDVVGERADGKLFVSTIAGQVDLGASIAGTSLPLLIDADADGKPDVVAVTPDGIQHVFPNTSAACKPSLGAKVDLGTGWQSIVRTSSADLDGDGKVDILATRNDGHLLAYLNAGTPGAPKFAEANDLGTGWLGVARVRTFDADGDGKVDVLGETSDGNVAVWLGAGTKGAPKLGPKIVLAGSFSALDRIVIGDADKDGKQDVLARRADGALVVMLSTGTPGKPALGAAIEVGKGWEKITRMLYVGGDLVARSPDGALDRRTQTSVAGRPSWDAPKPLGSGWQDVVRVVLP